MNGKVKDVEHLDTIVQRRNWLKERIKAKEIVGWETEWDKRECDAHTWAINILKDYLNSKKEPFKSER